MVSKGSIYKIFLNYCRLCQVNSLWSGFSCFLSDWIKLKESEMTTLLIKMATKKTPKRMSILPVHPFDFQFKFRGPEMDERTDKLSSNLLSQNEMDFSIYELCLLLFCALFSTKTAHSKTLQVYLFKKKEKDVDYLRATVCAHCSINENKISFSFSQNSLFIIMM